MDTFTGCKYSQRSHLTTTTTATAIIRTKTNHKKIISCPN